jgi:V/A-type H+-transporting ATPase subunit A
MVHGVLMGDFEFDDKDQARRYFNELRQLFIDWNYIAWDDETFKQQEAKIVKRLQEAHTHA